ncbi:MAG: GTPase [Symploca sp. SIO3C6]|uniref:GTPase n=1 Tax=Symploca sp. SIO1C4 TaxID=2607765 RepID=A0A6B3NAV0_9CYAN|nr:GTPase [Symploca sp. SIO3C6]NER28710.1 GTPase [Symploca sp. SIO1C4]NET06974.1 GTPase [Symploca sp. SIO2B6]NET49819.1 GTPase [Merismopedia sp. SIO2A8]
MKFMRSVVAGTPGAGKSTFVRMLSDIEVVDTDRRATDETSLYKRKTTVAFDFGRLLLGPNLELHIYGTPGQARFNFMWDMLIRRAHTYIMLVTANRPRDFVYARQIISFMNQRVQIPMMVGLTHMDCPGAWSQKEIMLALGYINAKNRPPVVVVNPNDKTSVVEAMLVLMGLVIAGSNVKLSNTP